VIPLLTYSTLFPNREQPVHGLFVEERLRQLLGTGRIAASVIAPVPWFPFGAPVFGSYARFARVPRSEQRNGLTISHPRYALLPKIGMLSAPFLMAASTVADVRRALASGADRPIVDAHYLYPDGVAAALIARALDLPLVLTARGSDVNLIARHPLARRMLLWAIRRSRATVTVSAALKAALVAFGADERKLHVIRNGVNLARFAPRDRAVARRRVGVDGFVVLTVGKLDENKGHHLVVDALSHCPGATHLIVGEGPWRDGLARRAASAGIGGRVRLLGAVGHDELPDYYAAADVLVLASAREGMPNVVLEALACGLPVIATDVGGVAEILQGAPACTLLAERSSEAVARALAAVAAASSDRDAVRRHAERFGWEAVASAQLEVLESVPRGGTR